MEFVLIALVIWLAFGFVGWKIMADKGRSGAGGLLLGLLFGVIGLIIALVMRPSLEHQVREQQRIRDILREDD